VSSNPDIGLVDEPIGTHGVSVRSSSTDQDRRKSLNPTEQGDVVDLNPALGQEFLEVPIRKAVPKVPAHGEQDDLGWEPTPGEH
jgi:hypothetical protein